MLSFIFFCISVLFLAIAVVIMCFRVQRLESLYVDMRDTLQDIQNFRHL